MNCCDTCQWLISEETSKAVGIEHWCCWNPTRIEIFGPSEYFCGMWVENLELAEKRRIAEAEKAVAHHRLLMEAEHKAMQERDRMRRDRGLMKSEQEDQYVREYEARCKGRKYSPPPPRPRPTCPPVFPKLVVDPPDVDQKKLSLREKMKRRFS